MEATRSGSARDLFLINRVGFSVSGPPATIYWHAALMFI